jgi:hypothetical protein
MSLWQPKKGASKYQKIYTIEKMIKLAEKADTVPKAPQNAPPRLPRPPPQAHQRPRPRRQYAHPAFEFEPIDSAAQIDVSSLDEAEPKTHTAQPCRAETTIPVSPCINATDRTDRARRSGASFGELEVTETFHDITPLLREDSRAKDKAREKIPEMRLEESDDEGDFDIIEKPARSEHNGTERKWYRAWRH